ncbi:diguanylate cyclase [Sphingosinicella terrae]|uniref:diguanylate cyclase n=1 Tax=Sphingosinicella terrae TaxID=2172047 RepID=UPI0013B391CE|nr:diguanylate cyclase [Sphingosinicella terrae]
MNISLLARFHARSVGAGAARSIILWAALAILVLTGLGYQLASARAERVMLEELSAYVAQRGRAESQPFLAAEANLEMVRDRFLELYNDPAVLPAPRFEEWFVEDRHGALRLRREYFEGRRDADGTLRRGTSGFMGRKRPPLTPELRRRLVLAYQLVDRFGPAWIGQFDNFHISLPENALIIHWPGGNWGWNADPELDMVAGAVIRSTLASENPSRRPVWSGLYYDLTAGHWALTYQLPVDLGGRHLINPSHDIRVGDLVRRLAEDHPLGGRNLIVSEAGKLVAQPERMADILRNRGVLDIAQLGDPALRTVHQALRDQVMGRVATGESRILWIDALDAYVAFTRIEGPDWWFVTIFPGDLVSREAHRAAGLILVGGLLLLGLTSLIVLSVLRRRVARPLAALENASRRIAAGDHQSVAGDEIDLPDDRQDEIGLLARAFRSMAAEIGSASAELERNVAARTVELQLANRRLEQLSLRDGLTGAFNRRALDSDLDAAVTRARELGIPCTLLLCDIDHFKLYNDHHGHLAGDEVIELVASTIAQCVPDERVYRFGGEEFAAILDPTLCDPAAIGEQLVRRIAALGIPHPSAPRGQVTISVGIATADEGTSEASALLLAADEQLYRAKEEGRNRACWKRPDGGRVSKAA